MLLVHEKNIETGKQEQELVICKGGFSSKLLVMLLVIICFAGVLEANKKVFCYSEYVLEKLRNIC